MTLYRRLFRTTHPMILASVASSALWTVPSASHAQQLMSPVTAGPSLQATPAPVLISPSGTATAAQLTPAPLPVAPLQATQQMQHPMHAMHAMQPTHYANQQQQMQQQARPATTNRPTEPVGQIRQIQHQSSDPSLLDRFKGVFRGRGPAPVDPGMNYPKASQARQGQQEPTGNIASTPTAPLVPGISEEIPSIPSMRNSSQPGLFQAPTAANPIHDLVPPSPAGSMADGSMSGGGGLTSIIPPPAASNGGLLIPPTPDEVAAGVQVRRVSELAQTRNGETRVADASPSQSPTASTASSLPRLDFNAPIQEPVPAKMIAPGEPSDTGLTLKPAPQPAPARSADPFADLFPGDAKTAATNSGPAVPPASDSPYTGMKLEPVAEMSTASTASANPQLTPVPPTSSASPAVPSAADVASVPPPPFEPSGLTPSGQVKLQPTLQSPEAAQTTSQVPPVPPPYEAMPERTALVPVPARETTLVPVEPKSEITIRPAPPREKDPRSKFELIAARQGQKGLKGFCPVVLRDSRDLVDSSSEFSYTYNGRTFEFSSAEAVEKFAAEPLKYAPANGCSDVIHLALTGEMLEGSLDHAVWYKGRLYLFSSVETMETFVAAPSSHASIE